jgi:glutathione S-transferase
LRFVLRLLAIVSRDLCDGVGTEEVAPRERALGFVEQLDRRLGDSPYLGGDAYTIADIAA